VQQELICQGQIQINSANTNGGEGNVSVSVDLPNGPKPGTVWIIDAAGVLFSDNQVTADAFQPGWCGFYIVPVGLAKPDATDTFGSINLQARGLPLGPGFDPDSTSDFFTSFAVPGNGYGFMTFKGPVIIPAGFTLRAVLSGTNGVAGLQGAIQMNLYAQLRTLNQQN
jgi:hypothetical protein